MNWFLFALSKYADFSGRSRRSEYGYFILFYLLLYFALTALDRLTGLFAGVTSIGVFAGIFSLLMLIPSIAVSVRRLHDTGRSCWWLLISIMPVIGTLVLIAFALQDGQQGENRFGDNPKVIM